MSLSFVIKIGRFLFVSVASFVTVEPGFELGRVVDVVGIGFVVVDAVIDAVVVVAFTDPTSSLNTCPSRRARKRNSGGGREAGPNSRSRSFRSVPEESFPV